MENSIPLLVPEKLDEKMIRAIIEQNGGRGFAVKGIPMEQYRNLPGLSSSDVKALITGTIDAWIEGKKNPQSTPALILGNAIHTMSLEKELFWDRYCLEEHAPKAPARSTKEGKQEWVLWLECYGLANEMTSDEWKAAWIKWRHPEFKKIILTHEDVEICEGIAASIENHPMVSQLFAEGDSEITLIWIDKETGIICRCRPDRLNQSWPCIPDIKSCLDASLDSFEGDITNRLYYVSAYWYLWGAKEVFQRDFENFVYVPCEKHPPYQVTFYTADEGSLAAGEGLCRAGLTIYKRFIESTRDGVTKPHRIWVGYSLEPKAAGIRPWAFNKISQVIHSHDLHGLGLEKYVGGV